MQCNAEYVFATDELIFNNMHISVHKNKNFLRIYVIGSCACHKKEKRKKNDEIATSVRYNRSYPSHYVY
jgi:hypothetical protein